MGQKSQLPPVSTSHFTAFQMLPSRKICTCTYLHASQSLTKPTPQLFQNESPTLQDTVCNLGDLPKIAHCTTCCIFFYEGFLNSYIQQSNKSCFDSSEDMTDSAIKANLRKLSVALIHSFFIKKSPFSPVIMWLWTQLAEPCSSANTMPELKYKGRSLPPCKMCGNFNTREGLGQQR